MSARARVRELVRADYEFAVGPATSARQRVAMVVRLLTNPSMHASLLLRLAGPGGHGPRSLWLWLLRHKHRIELQDDVQIGPGLDMPHPIRIVFGSGTRIGPRVLVAHNVTFAPSAPAAPTTVGAGVRIFPSSTFAPGTVVGEGAVIGANSAVRGTVAPASTYSTRRPPGPAPSAPTTQQEHT